MNASLPATNNFLHAFKSTVSFLTKSHNLTKPHRIRKALLIGVDSVKTGEAELKYPCRDVQDAKKFLLDIGFLDENIILLFDKGNQDQVTKPTSENVMNALDEFIGPNPTSDTTYFLVYSGHSGQKKELGDVKVEVDGLEEFIIPSDATLEDEQYQNVITDKVLHEKLVKPLKGLKRTQLVALFDSCHSGTLLNLKHDRCNRVGTATSLGRRTFRRLVTEPIEWVKLKSPPQNEKHLPSPALSLMPLTLSPLHEPSRLLKTKASVRSFFSHSNTSELSALGDIPALRAIDAEAPSPPSPTLQLPADAMFQERPALRVPEQGYEQHLRPPNPSPFGATSLDLPPSYHSRSPNSPGGKLGIGNNLEANTPSPGTSILHSSSGSPSSTSAQVGTVESPILSTRPSRPTLRARTSLNGLAQKPARKKQSFSSLYSQQTTPSVDVQSPSWSPSRSSRLLKKTSHPEFSQMPETVLLAAIGASAAAHASPNLSLRAKKLEVPPEESSSSSSSEDGEHHSSPSIRRTGSLSPMRPLTADSSAIHSSVLHSNENEIQEEGIGLGLEFRGAGDPEGLPAGADMLPKVAAKGVTDGVSRASSIDFKQKAPRCNGFCPRMYRLRKKKKMAKVICISACKDSQSAYELDGGSTMVNAIIDLLRDNDRPSYKEVINAASDISEKNRHTILDIIDREYLDNRPLALPRWLPVPWSRKDIASRQDRRQMIKDLNRWCPQISSLKPLDMRARLSL